MVDMPNPNSSLTTDIAKRHFSREAQPSKYYHQSIPKPKSTNKQTNKQKKKKRKPTTASYTP